MASLTEKTGSSSQVTNRLLSSSVNLVGPKYFAREGILSMTMSRTRHCLSLPSSLMHGSKD